MSLGRTLGAVVLILAAAAGCSKKPVRTVEYEGEIPGHNVRISGSYDGKVWKTVAFVDAKEAKEGGMAGVAGHDYGSDGFWDRIFITYPGTGSNAVRFYGNEVTWEPCPGDKDRVGVFTPRQIGEAKKLLEQALESAGWDHHLAKPSHGYSN